MGEKNKKARERILAKWMTLLCLDPIYKPMLKTILSCLPNKQAGCHFIIIDLKRGISPTIICERYNITPGELRGIGERCGHYEPKIKSLHGVDTS